MARDITDDYVMVPRQFVRESLRGRPTRNFASEYIRWVLGQNLRAARRAAGLDQKTLARKIGKAQSTVAMAERGQIKVSSVYVRAVLRATKAPKDWSMRYWRR
jgi:ribosome-binding protein aMBF1 (putative translation factor)